MTSANLWKAIIFLFLGLGGSNTESWASSAEDRVRLHFSIHDSVPLTEETIKQAVLQVIPVGLPASLIKQKLLAIGIGENGLSRFIEPGKDNVAVIRIDYDPKTFQVVKRSYVVSIHLTSGAGIRTIQSVDVAEFLTGL